MAMRNEHNKFFPLVIVNVLLIALTYIWANLYSINFSFYLGILSPVWLFPILFLLWLIAISLLESVWHVRRFVTDETGQVDLKALCHSSRSNLNPINGMIVVILMGAGVTGSANLTEIYRATTNIWYDGMLWEIEKPLFSALLGSWLAEPAVWDIVYFMVWLFLIPIMALIYKIGHFQRFIQIAIAVVLAFYLTRFINLVFPTTGPIFYQPELFDLGGTLSERTQEVLRLYMAGQVTQNGITPGTMAMPSLHVGLTAMAAWFLAGHWRWTLWLTIPWLMLIWMSTIMLGWHYALDGVGGVLIASLSIFIAQKMLMVQAKWPLTFRTNNLDVK